MFGIVNNRICFSIGCRRRIDECCWNKIVDHIDTTKIGHSEWIIVYRIPQWSPDINQLKAFPWDIGCMPFHSCMSTNRRLIDVNTLDRLSIRWRIDHISWSNFTYGMIEENNVIGACDTFNQFFNFTIICFLYLFICPIENDIGIDCAW